jgi:hypothetical protein
LHAFTVEFPGLFCYNISVKTRALLTVILLLSAVILSGCQTTITVHNASKKDIAPIFKDYVGMHGYVLRYQNDTTGTYNVDMGQVYVQGTSTATKNKSIVMQPSDSSTGQPLTAYEQSTWTTVNNPAHYEDAFAAVSISQRDSDVIVFIDTNGAGGSSLDDIRNYFKSYGYQVD